jgi:hypothetical protein
LRPSRRETTGRSASSSTALPRSWRRGCAGLLLLAVLALTLATRSGVGYDWTLARNVAGLVGLALLAATVAGSVVAWAIPLGYAALVVLAGPGADWALPLRPFEDQTALIVALVLLLVGLFAGGRHGLFEDGTATG